MPPFFLEGAELNNGLKVRIGILKRDERLFRMARIAFRLTGLRHTLLLLHFYTYIKKKRERRGARATFRSGWKEEKKKREYYNGLPFCSFALCESFATVVRLWKIYVFQFWESGVLYFFFFIECLMKWVWWVFFERRVINDILFQWKISPVQSWLCEITVDKKYL